MGDPTQLPSPKPHAPAPPEWTLAYSALWGTISYPQGGMIPLTPTPGIPNEIYANLITLPSQGTWQGGFSDQGMGPGVLQQNPFL